jgi:TolA-binding protein
VLSTHRQSETAARLYRGLALLVLLSALSLRGHDPATLGTSRLQEVSSQYLENAAFGRAVPYLAELDRRLRESDETAAVRARGPILYFLGLGRLQLADLFGADQAFNDFIAGYPDSPRLASAQMYRADTFYYRQEWSNAAAIYAQVVTDGQVAALSPELRARFWEHYADCVFVERDWARGETVFPAFQQSTAGWPDPAVAAEKHSKASSYLLQAAMETEDFAQAMAQLPAISEQKGTARHDLSLNLALMRGGDRLYEAQRYGEALYFYELVLRPDELRVYWAARIAELTVEQSQREGVEWFAERLLQIERELQQARARIGQLGGPAAPVADDEENVVADYGPALAFRIARCYMARGRSFEAYWAFQRLEQVAAAMVGGQAESFSEEALYGQVKMAAASGFDDRVGRLARRYLRTAPYTRFIGDVAYELLQTAIRAEHEPTVWELTEAYLERVRLDPTLQEAPKLIYLVGSTLVEARHYDVVQEQLAPMLAQYPDRGFSDGLRYWLGLVDVMEGRFGAALAHFDGIVREYPDGSYSEDAAYRIGVSQFGLLAYRKARRQLEGFLQDHPESRLVCEAQALLGDIAAAEGRWEAALQAYSAAREAGAWMSPPNLAYLNHAVFAAGDIFAAQGRWIEMAEWFEGYLRRWGRTGRAGDALYQLGRAQVALGRSEEMLELWIESILEFGDDPRDSGPDLMLAEFPEHFRAIRGDSPADVLQDALAIATAQDKATLRFRLAWALEQLDVAPENLPQMTREQLAAGSAAVLVAVANRERDRDPELALAAAERSLALDRWGPYAADALMALAELHTAAARPSAAIDAWRELADSFPTHTAAATARLRQGDLERERGAFDAAKAAYRAVLQVRQWRGAAWAEANFKIGLTHFESGNFEAAFGFCQRVYVLYPGIENWAAEAYLVSGMALENLNRSHDAAATYRELLADEGLADEAAAAAAAARLAALEEVS